MYFEDFTLGQIFRLEPISLTEAEIRQFAESYDPLPIHTEPDFAASSIFGGIIASGFHTLSAVWGRWIRLNKLGTEVIGGLGIDYLRWTAPVRPGDQLRAEVEISELIPSSKGGRGIVGMKVSVSNQHGESVLVAQVKGLMKGRHQ